MTERFIEGPGIIIEPSEDVPSLDGSPFTIALDEEYLTELISAKFGIEVKPRG